MEWMNEREEEWIKKHTDGKIQKEAHGTESCVIRRRKTTLNISYKGNIIQGINYQKCWQGQRSKKWMMNLPRDRQLQKATTPPRASREKLKMVLSRAHKYHGARIVGVPLLPLEPRACTSNDVKSLVHDAGLTLKDPGACSHCCCSACAGAAPTPGTRAHD